MVKATAMALVTAMVMTTVAKTMKARTMTMARTKTVVAMAFLPDRQQSTK